MRKAALGMSMALLAGVALAACGNEPEPIAPVSPSFDSTTETTDTDEQGSMVPGTLLPETDTVPPTGSEPGEIPEVMEEGTFTPDEPRSDAAGDMIENPDETAENPM